MSKRKLGGGYGFDNEDKPGVGTSKKYSRPTPPLYIACVEFEASSTFKEAQGKADPAISEKIKKMLALGNHPTANPHQAKRAIALAHKLSRQHQIPLAEVIEQESPDKLIEHTGHSVVSIKRTDGDLTKAVRQHCYVGRLCRAMTDFFICKYYSTNTKPDEICTAMNFTFYGVAEHTITAAHAFAMVYNVLSKGARKHKGISSQNSYCLGAGDELLNMAKAAKKAERAQAKQEEAKLQEVKDGAQSEEETYEGHNGSYVPDVVDSHGSAFNDFDNLGDDIDDFINPERRTESSLVVWKSEQQIINYEQSSLKAAEDWIKNQDTKLYKSRKRKITVHDPSAYHRGVQTAEDLDVYRKRLGQ